MNPRELIEILEDKLKQMPTDIELREKLAFLLLSHGNLDRAESLFKEILRTNSHSPNALWGLVKLNWQKKLYDEAHFYIKLLTNCPDYKLNKEQALLFSKILAKNSDFIHASKWLDTAISQDSSLLQTEMPFLKYIRQNLMPDTERRMNGIPIPIMPSKYAQYILLEIASSEDFFDDRQQEEAEIEENNENSSPPITFDQIGGLRKVKQFLIQEVALPLKNAQLCSIYNKSTTPRILLYGPSGCGKTLVCRALAMETEISFLALRPTHFMDLSFEEAEMRLAHLIYQAKENKPSVILIDEIDWLAKKAPEGNNEEEYLYKANLLKTLLEALKHQEQIGLIVTSSEPWNLDYKFFGNTKIDKHLFVPPPSAQERVEILRSSLEQKQSAVIVPEKIDTTKIIKTLKTLSSGADIEELIDLTLSELLVETIVNLQTGAKDKKSILTTERLIKTGRRLKKVPIVDLWLNEAKKQLKPTNSPFHHLWTQIDESESLNSNGKIYKNIIKNRLLPSE